MARLLVRHQVKCAHYVNSKSSLNTLTSEKSEKNLWLLYCFIAYVICISFSFCQFPFAFLSMWLVNHLEFIKYFPLLYFTLEFQTTFFLPLPLQNALHYQMNRKGGGDPSLFHIFGVVPGLCLVHAVIQWGTLDLEYFERSCEEWTGSEDGKSHIVASKMFIGEMYIFCALKKKKKVRLLECLSSLLSPCVLKCLPHEILQFLHCLLFVMLVSNPSPDDCLLLRSYLLQK